MKVLVLGANGMLGNAMFRILSEMSQWEVFGTVRSAAVAQLLPPQRAAQLIAGCDVADDGALDGVFARLHPDVVINCISLPRHSSSSGDPLLAIPIYSLLPHRLAGMCRLVGARLVHMSTDGVFSGAKGGYSEDDTPDARDLYGVAKHLGEVNYPHAITLRTSIIGHALRDAHGLIDWFLAQSGSCSGYTRSVFSGLPNVTIARLIRDVVIPRPDLCGLFHVAARPVSKYALLRLVADTYGKSIDIVKDDSSVIDRSLNSKRFEAATGYVAPEWPALVADMHADWCRRSD